MDWNVFLARDPLTITSSEWLEARELAHKWPTCACGQLCKDLPRVTEGKNAGRPVDLWLGELGGHFYRAIAGACSATYAKDKRFEALKDYFDEAKERFAEIEERTQMLLEERRKRGN